VNPQRFEHMADIVEDVVARIFQDHPDWPEQTAAAFEEHFGQPITPTRIAAMTIVAQISQHFHFVTRKERPHAKNTKT
jgi:hypothetical protein